MAEINASFARNGVGLDDIGELQTTG